MGDPHIADFGLAMREDARHLLAGEVAGTLAFMAPEQVRGETHRFDGRTDVWAMGVILYSALTGRLPFRGKDRRGVSPHDPRAGPEAAPRDRHRDPPRAGADLPEVPGQADGRSLRDGRRAGRRPE